MAYSRRSLITPSTVGLKKSESPELVAAAVAVFAKDGLADLSTKSAAS